MVALMTLPPPMSILTTALIAPSFISATVPFSGLRALSFLKKQLPFLAVRGVP